MSLPPQLSDAQLVAMVRATGDADAFGLLVERHRPALLAFLVRYTGDPHQSEDIAQDAFIKAYERVGSYRGDASFRTWLFSVAHREFLQSARRGNVVQRMIARLRGGSHDAPVDDDASDPDPGTGLDLDQALKCLSGPERAALLFADACGMSHSEVSSAMDAPVGSVKTYIRRARQKMAAAMGDDYAG